LLERESSISPLFGNLEYDHPLRSALRDLVTQLDRTLVGAADFNTHVSLDWYATTLDLGSLPYRRCIYMPYRVGVTRRCRLLCDYHYENL
jgi:hypothetical protein